MDHLLRTIRVGGRSLRRTPGFSTTAVLTLAIGIGLSTAVFTVAEALLIRRLPVVDQNRIVLLWGETRDGRFSNYPLGYQDVRKFVRDSRTLQFAASSTFFLGWCSATRVPRCSSSARRSGCCWCSRA